MRHGPNGKPSGRRREAEGAAAMIAMSVVAEAYQASWATLRGVRSRGAERPSRQHVIAWNDHNGRGYWHGGQWQAFDAGWRPGISSAASFSSDLNFRMLCRLRHYSRLRPRADAAIVKRACGPRKRRAEGMPSPLRQWRATALVSI